MRRGNHLWRWPFQYSLLALTIFLPAFTLAFLVLTSSHEPLSKPYVPLKSVSMCYSSSYPMTLSVVERKKAKFRFLSLSGGIERDSEVYQRKLEGEPSFLSTAIVCLVEASRCNVLHHLSNQYHLRWYEGLNTLGHLDEALDIHNTKVFGLNYKRREGNSAH